MLLLIHTGLGADTLSQHNATIDESGHLLSGLLALQHGDVTYYYVNPPLVKMLQSVPMVPAELQLPAQRGPVSGAHWMDGVDKFLDSNQLRFLSLVPLARCVNLLLSLASAWLLYRWSHELFGAAAGLVALTLWTLCPTVLAWAGVCTADLGAAFFALAAMAGLRTYLRRPTFLTAGWAGLLLGLAQLSKFTLLVLYALTLILCLVVLRTRRVEGVRVHQVGALLVVSLFVLNAGYGFQDVGRPLGGFMFKCRLLSGADGWDNRFRASWLEHVPVPLPAAYILGLDEQKSQDDRGFSNYLCGEWKHGGWWYYYLVAGLVKIPIGTWLLAVGALSLTFFRRFRAGLLDEALLWLPALAIVLLVSSQTGINGHFRYILPAFPFAFIAISRVGKIFDAAVGGGYLRYGGAVAVAACLIWNAADVVRYHPHHVSYFNQIAGGPDNGWKWLAESNIDWGQDLLFLKRWIDDHPDEAASLRLAYYGGVPPHLLGVVAPSISWQDGPHPGWYAVSVNAFAGMAFFVRNSQGERIHYPQGAFHFFQQFTPVAKAGYSIFIYHLSPAEVNIVRQRLGFPAL